LHALTNSLAVLAAVASVAAGVAGASPAPVHAAACKHVTIQGHRACLAPGKYCTRQWESSYRRYGYTCSFLDRNDRYHLRRLPRH
jgi:uncharacterized membrane protein